MRNTAATERKLAEAQRVFFAAADSVAVHQWNIKPASESWSAAEVVAHVMMVERTVIDGAHRITQKTPRKIPFHQRIHLPLWLVEARIIKRKTPIPLDPNLLCEKQAMLSGIHSARERTLAFMEKTKELDLSKYCWPHPFLGMLNAYEWLEMIAAHQIRHAKQVKEIVERLPKVGESSRK